MFSGPDIATVRARPTHLLPFFVAILGLYRWLPVFESINHVSSMAAWPELPQHLVSQSTRSPAILASFDGNLFLVLIQALHCSCLLYYLCNDERHFSRTRLAGHRYCVSRNSAEQIVRAAMNTSQGEFMHLMLSMPARDYRSPVRLSSQAVRWQLPEII